MKVTELVAIIALLLLAASTSAEERISIGISPGQYILSGDSGTLNVRRDDSGKLVFDMESSGSNCHICSVSGTIQGKLGHADNWPDGSDSDCYITFEQRGTEIKVTSTTEGCRAFCGARAGLEGNYRRPPAFCTRSSQQNRRNEFLRLYRLRKYSSAIKVLEPLLSQCSQFLYWIDIDRIRNDLALAHLHSGNPDACIQILAATEAASHAGEEKLRDFLPPCDAENYIDVAKATWFNKSLCQKASVAQRGGAANRP